MNQDYEIHTWDIRRPHIPLGSFVGHTGAAPATFGAGTAPALHAARRPVSHHRNIASALPGRRRASAPLRAPLHGWQTSSSRSRGRPRPTASGPVPVTGPSATREHSRRGAIVRTVAAIVRTPNTIIRTVTATASRQRSPTAHSANLYPARAARHTHEYGYEYIDIYRQVDSDIYTYTCIHIYITAPRSAARRARRTSPRTRSAADAWRCARRTR